MPAIPDYFAGAVLVNTGERLPVMGDLEVPELREGQVSQRFLLHHINDALDDLENHKIVRALFEFETAKDV